MELEPFCSQTSVRYNMSLNRTQVMTLLYLLVFIQIIYLSRGKRMTNSFNNRKRIYNLFELEKKCETRILE